MQKVDKLFIIQKMVLLKHSNNKYLPRKIFVTDRFNN